MTYKRIYYYDKKGNLKLKRNKRKTLRNCFCCNKSLGCKNIIQSKRENRFGNMIFCHKCLGFMLPYFDLRTCDLKKYLDMII